METTASHASRWPGRRIAAAGAVAALAAGVAIVEPGYEDPAAADNFSCAAGTLIAGGGVVFLIAAPPVGVAALGAGWALAVGTVALTARDCVQSFNGGRSGAQASCTSFKGMQTSSNGNKYGGYATCVGVGGGGGGGGGGSW